MLIFDLLSVMGAVECDMRTLDFVPNKSSTSGTFLGMVGFCAFATLSIKGPFSGDMDLFELLKFPLLRFLAFFLSSFAFFAVFFLWFSLDELFFDFLVSTC